MQLDALSDNVKSYTSERDLLDKKDLKLVRRVSKHCVRKCVVVYLNNHAIIVIKIIHTEIETFVELLSD